MRFQQAKNYTKSARTHVSLIVIHTAETHERADSAENVAAYFAGSAAPKASAHYVVDSDSEVQCVRDEDVAWHAGEVNGWSIGIEHAGRAAQTPEEWEDEFSQAMLRRSAKLCAVLVKKYDIPVCKLSPELVRTGEKGFCGHVDVNDAYGHKGGHWDPGPSFPWDAFLVMVGEELDALVAAG